MLAPIRRRTAMALAVALAVGAPALAGCVRRAAPLPPAPATVTIGLLAPTGSPLGRSARQGAELAVDVVNAGHPELSLPAAARSGLGRRSRLTLVVGDTGGTPDVGAQATADLLRRHPYGMVVMDVPAVVQSAEDRTEEAAVPLVDGYTTADVLTGGGRQWYFRTVPDDAELMAAVFDALNAMAVQRGDAPAAGSGRLTVLDGAAAGTDGLPDAVQLTQSRGFTLAGRLSLASGSAAATKVDAQRPDGVVALVGTDQEAAAAADVAAQRRSNSAPVFALGRGSGAVTGNMLRTVGWSADYAARNPVAAAVGELYRKRFSAAMDEPAAGAFTAVITLADAVRGALASGALNPTRVRAEIRQMNVPATQLIMPWTGVLFDPSGQNASATGVVERRDGDAFAVVYPRELARRAAAP